METTLGHGRSDFTSQEEELILIAPLSWNRLSVVETQKLVLNCKHNSVSSISITVKDLFVKPWIRASPTATDNISCARYEVHVLLVEAGFLFVVICMSYSSPMDITSSNCWIFGRIMHRNCSLSGLHSSASSVQGLLNTCSSLNKVILEMEGSSILFTQRFCIKQRN